MTYHVLGLLSHIHAAMDAMDPELLVPPTDITGNLANCDQVRRTPLW
ncbi:MAG: hypothetical protein AAFS10_17840 [Myxococcota bacterium]